MAKGLPFILLLSPAINILKKFLEPKMLHGTKNFYFFPQAAPTRQCKFSVSILRWWELSLETHLCSKNDFLTWKIKTNVIEISLDEKIHIIFSANHKRDNQQLFCPISLELAKNAHITEHSQHQSKTSVWNLSKKKWNSFFNLAK